jgi:hypothetical protein
VIQVFVNPTIDILLICGELNGEMGSKIKTHSENRG